MAHFDQTDFLARVSVLVVRPSLAKSEFGKNEFGPNQVWPKPSLAQTDFGQSEFGQSELGTYDFGQTESGPPTSHPTFHSSQIRSVRYVFRQEGNSSMSWVIQQRPCKFV